MKADPALTSYLQMFLKSTDTHGYPKDAIVFSEGDPGDLYFLVLNGAVRIEIGGVVVRMVQAGEGFGETALLDGGPRSATAIVETDCKLYAMSPEKFDEFVENPHFVRPILEHTLKRARAAEQKIVELTKGS